MRERSIANSQWLHEKFSSVDGLLFLNTKIMLKLNSQRYIEAALGRAFKNSDMIGILGQEGVGKSSAIAYFHFKQTQANMRVIYVKIGESYTIASFLNEIIFQISGLYPKITQTLFEKVKYISYLLTKDSNKKIVIVDDAGKLKPRALGFFHEIRDNTLHTTGFAFVALPYFQNNLLRAKKSGVPGIGEFYRRIQSWITVDCIGKQEIHDYSKMRKLRDDQVNSVIENSSSLNTIGELELLVNKILEVGEQTQETPLKGEKTNTKNRRQRATSKRLTREDTVRNRVDEFESEFED